MVFFVLVNLKARRFLTMFRATSVIHPFLSPSMQGGSRVYAAASSVRALHAVPILSTPCGRPGYG